MTQDRLAALLTAFADLRIVVLGDYFVDQYLMIDPTLAELSLETGLEAHQVVEVRAQPGAAGTVTNNLSALGVGTILAVGYHGTDGYGHELRRGLREAGVHVDYLVPVNDRVTPTYTKPLVLEPGGPRELSRLDIKNRCATPSDVEDQVIAALTAAAADADAVIVLDQVDQPSHGVVTERVREAVAELARERPDRPVIADSRAHIQCFRDVMVKVNVHEATAALRADGERGMEALPREALAAHLVRRQHRPCFVTLGDEGVLAAEPAGVQHVPAVPVPGPIDIVGAGDSFNAAATAALAAGASLTEAAQVGNLVASLTVQQLGTTGTASPAEVLARLAESPFGD